jgi:hypothetical protein
MIHFAVENGTHEKAKTKILYTKRKNGYCGTKIPVFICLCIKDK